jgi:hypothetical protein
MQGSTPRDWRATWLLPRLAAYRRGDAMSKTNMRRATLISLMLALCGCDNADPIYLRCDLTQGPFASNPDHYVMLVIDPQRSEIKFQHFHPGSVADFPITYRISHSDTTTFKGTITPDNFIEVNRSARLWAK